MFLPIQFFIVLLLIVKFVQPLDVFDEPSRDQRAQNLMTLGKVVQFIVESKMRQDGRRHIKPGQLAKAKSLYRTLAKNMSPVELKKWLRQQEESITDAPIDVGGMRDEQASLIEMELKSALAHKKSALLDKPYVEQGRNDYLVMRPDVLDPFVTVVPNAIYYNIEKKCVNWLDDCSLQGIRARLLKGVQSPYK